MDQLDLKNKKKQKELYDIFEEIDKNILDEEEDIIFELEKSLNDLDDEDKSKAIKFINTKYSNCQFIRKLSTSAGDSDIKDLYQKQNYYNLRQQNQLEQIMQLIRNPSFCRENNIPPILEQNIFIIQKLGCSKFKEILEIWENQNDYNNLQILEQIRKLLSIVYCKSLTNDEQNKIHIMLGSMLIKQIYQFQIYMEQLEKNNYSLFKKLTFAIQCKQMNLQITQEALEELKQHHEFDFLYKLFTQDIRQSKEYLNDYLREIMKKDALVFPETQLIQYLESAFSTVTEIFQCYFTIVVYLWIQCGSQGQMIEQLNQLEIKRDQTIEERRLTLYERFLSKLMKTSKDQVFLFFVSRLIFFNDKNDQLVSQSTYEDFKLKYQNYSQEILKFQMNVCELVSLQPQEYEIFLSTIQNLLFFQCFSHYTKQYQQFLLILLLTEFQKTDQKQFFYLFHQSQVNIIECAISIKEQFQKKTKNTVLKILSTTFEFYGFEMENTELLLKLYQKFNSFNDGKILFLFKNILQGQQVNYQNIEFISRLSILQLGKIKHIFDQNLLQNITHKILQFYLNNLEKDRRLFYIALNKLFLTLEKQVSDLECFRILLKNIDYKLLHTILKLNNPHLHSFELFQTTLFTFYTLHQRLSLHDQDLLSAHLSTFIKPQAYNFSLYHEQKLNNTDCLIIHKMLLVYYYQDVGDIRKLELICSQIYEWNREFYQTWLEPLHYFQIFSISSQNLRRRQLQNQYPMNMNIELENFNISLVEFTDKEQETIVSDWVNSMSEPINFLKLIPLFFNIIKRGESPKNLLSLIHKWKKKNIIGSFNMKALFQILFNNANVEMKTMLLKFWSKNHPLPFVFQNFNCQRIQVEEHLYIFNQYLFYIWQDSFPIINLTFSKKRSQIGKTQLINQIFFQMEKFETCDSCEINKDTADIIFDYSFNGSRHLTVADVHGRLPIAILKIVLPLFRLWVIQLDSECELEENYVYLKNFDRIREENNPQICFLIRNSTQDLQNQFTNEIIKLKSKNIAVHFVKDLTSKEIDKQILQNEMEDAAKFLFTEIKKQYYQKNFIGQNYFIWTLQKFNNMEYESFIELISQHSQLIQNLLIELNILINKPDGFFNQEAFPIRCIEQKIKQKKDEEIQLRLKPDQNQTKLEEIRKQIDELQKLMDQSNQTKLMFLFCSIFNSENYYILYIWVTDKIRKFNEEKMYQLQNENQELNEQIIKAKKERDELKQKNQSQFGDQIQQSIKGKINQLKKQLQESMNKIQLTNIGIEIFWRELIQQKELYPQSYIQINPTEKIFEMIKKGEPFEFLDGDQLKINSQFLKQLARKFQQKGEERILVLSILGPQSSGKSTILNKIFGCHFWTSVGRCTKGIYLQLLKLHNKQYFNDLFDYILLLDTEGLQNPNQQDQEFDKKIALFILAVSDIILINVKGDINQQFKNLVEMCIYTLGQLKSNFQSIKQLCWCFNQNNDVNNIGPFFDQIQEIATKLNTELNKTDTEDSKTDYNEILDIKKQNIKILGFSSYEKSWKSHQFFSNECKLNEWRQLISNDTFSEEAYHYGIEIIKGFSNKFLSQKDQRTLTTLNYFITNIDGNWNSIQMLPDLLEFSELIQHQQNQFMKIRFEELQNQLDVKFIQRISNDIFNEVQQSQSQSLEIFNEIQSKMEAEILQKIDINKKRATEDLQQIRVQNKISKKITVKYIKQLEQLINNQISESKLTIYEEIKNYERQYQEKQGFAQIDKFVSDLLENSQELIRYQEQPSLINSEFNVLWQNIIQKLDAQQVLLFDEFQFNQFQSIEQTFIQYSMKSQSHQQYLIFFKDKINKHNPNDNTKEKENIFQIFKNELSKSHFIPLNKNCQKNMRYVDIFHQNIEKKIKSSNENDLIYIGNFYTFQVTWGVIDKTQIEIYLQNLLFLDLLNYLKSRKPFYSQSFFSILDQFKTTFEVKLLQIVVDKIRIYLINRQKQQEDDLRVEFFKFSSTIKFNLQEQIEIQDDEFNSNFHQFYSNLRTYFLQQRYFPSLENLQQEKQYILRQYVIVKENKTVKAKEDGNQLFFSHIMNPLRSTLINQFSNNFPSIFNDIMLNQKGWQQLFYTVYDIIKNEMIDSKFNQPSESFISEKQKDQFDIEMLFDANINYSSSLIKIVMSKIEQKIEAFNKHFSIFGLILRDLGERIINYYSIFIIWRFICSKKWGILEKNKKMLQNNYSKQLEKFKAKINQDKQEQTKIKAESLVNDIYQGFIDRFYLENREQASQIIQKKSMSSTKLVLQLDDQLLKNFKKVKPINQEKEKENEQDIVNYITDQVSYINAYVDKYILKVQEEIQRTFEKSQRQELMNLLQQIKGNVVILKASIQNLYKTKQELFITDDENKTEEFYEQKLFFIILGCIQGESGQEINLLKDRYRPLFQSANYKKIQKPILIKFMNPSDQQVLLLQQFVDQVLQQIELKIKNIGQLQFNISNLQIQSQLDTLRLMMRGCQYSCPMCKRKCDLDAEKHEKHICNNGHQLRGMNGVLIDQTPSLFTCEEIEDDIMITTIENGAKRCWKEVKQIYPEWLFRSLTTNDVQKNKSKMMNVWNNGIGIIICEYLESQLNRKVLFQLKNDATVYFTKESMHYIFILDDSGSMSGLKWGNVKRAAEQCIKEIQKNLNATISVIIFNSTARLVIDCLNTNVSNSLIQYKGGGTNFTDAFNIAFLQMQKYEDRKFDKIVVLFYTDGEAEYPETALNKILSLSPSILERIQFSACTEEKDAPILNHIVATLKRTIAQSELKNCLQTSALNQVWSEVVSQNYHKLRC